MTANPIGIVIIGRNEGDRLKRCLRSVPRSVPTVYVDSGSSDGSVAFAESLSVLVVELDMSVPFSAARARNAGWRCLIEAEPDLECIQFIDGDCELDDRWLEQAQSALASEPDLAVVFGRRRERFPEASIYNAMCDDEWNVPIGLVASCGGDALFRLRALQQAGGYSDDLIAGEEPDLCLRLRRMGWSVRRIEDEMTLHDANILGFAPWWRRASRSGFAYAEHVRRHGSQSDPQTIRQTASILFWGFAAPVVAAAAAALLTPYSMVVAVYALVGFAGLYVLQISRIALRKRGEGHAWSFALPYGALIVIGKFAEVTGVFKCVTDQFLRRRSKIIEYK
ncbi:MAG: glycosyltransferase family A protein [Pseudomonadota bacterium]